jgi:tellurium resistance protein TerD
MSHTLRYAVNCSILLTRLPLCERPAAAVARYDLSEDASTETAMVFGELYRYQSEWKFRAVGQGYASGLAGIAMDFGVNVG